LKVRYETVDIPVIFLTAKGEIFDRVEGLSMGAHDYVAKPYHPDELRARIETALFHRSEKEKLRKEAEHFKKLTIIDEVTGFYNRKFLGERLEEEISRAKRYQYDMSLVIVCPDNIHRAKSGHGRLYSVNIIKQLANLISNNIRTIDIITSYSDDAFAIILPQTGFRGAKIFARKIVKLVDRHLFYGIVDRARVTVSVGAAVYRGEEIGDTNTLIEHCDQSLRNALSKGNSIEIMEV
jgi:two-component system, cell cycle response regulator